MTLVKQDLIAEAEPPKRWRSALHTVEATLSVLFAFLFGFMFIVFGGGILMYSWGEPGVEIAAAEWAIAAIAESAFLIWLKGSLEAGHRPFIPQFAISQPRWPVLLRPIFAVWWLSHFAIAALACYGLERLPFDLQTDVWLVCLKLVAYAVAVFTVTHSSQMYLLLSMTAVWNDPQMVYRAWKLRFLIDLAAIALVIGGVVASG